jgi:hypothetical protein
MRILLAAVDGCEFHRTVTDTSESLPTDLASAHAMILAERPARVEAEALAASTQAVRDKCRS